MGIFMIGAVIQLRSLRKALSADLSGSAALRQTHSSVLARVFTLLVVAGLVLGTLPGQDAAANPAAAASPTPTTARATNTPSAAVRTTATANTVRPAAASAPFITGTIWDDTKVRNAIYDDNEVGVLGVVVTIERVDVPGPLAPTAPCTNVVGNPNLITTTTNAEGRYRCDNLPAGTYRITIAIPAGSEATTPRQRDVIATVDGAIANFGLADLDSRVRTIGGRVFLDCNENGIQDLQVEFNEDPPDGFTVRLERTDGRSLQSESDSPYSFDNLDS